MKTLALWGALVMSLASTAATAEPIKLKFAYFGSDQSTTYIGGLKPFVDGVNADGRGLVEIVPYTSGSLGRDPTAQLWLVADGTTDIAFAVLGFTAEKFPDNAVLELPGLF